MRNQSLGWVFILLFLCLSPACAAETLVLDEAYWEDRTASASVSEAIDAPYQSYGGTVSKGYSRSAIWLKLRIAGQPAAQPLAIIVRPAFLQHIELYDAALMPEAGTAEPVTSGRDTVIEANNHIGFENGFIIPSSVYDRDVYLRIISNTALTVDVSVIPLTEADERSRILNATISLYFAVLLVFCVWALVNWGIQRDAIYGLFAIRQIYSAMHVFVFFGLLRYFFSHALNAGTRDIIYCLVTVTIVVAGSFDARLLSEFGASRRLLKIYFTIISASLISVLLVIAGYTNNALHINSFIVNMAMLLLLLLAISTHNRDKKPYGEMAVWIIRIGFMLMTAAVSIPVLMYQNIISSSVPLLNVLFAHAVISSIILFSVLSIRARQKDTLTQNSLIQYEIKSQELHQEQARRIEKERFLSMLTHELRNPLTVIRLLTDGRSSNGSAVQKAAIDMAKVIERVEESEKLGQTASELLRLPINLRAVLDEVGSVNGISELLDLDVPSELTVVSDETLFTRMLTNLIDNAVKYGSRASRITVKASDEIRNGRSGLTLSVSNEIEKLSLPDGDRLFSKYYRGRGAHRQPGSGLGLYLVKGWIEMLGGSISYEHNIEANGTSHVTFKLWIPQ